MCDKPSMNIKPLTPSGAGTFEICSPERRREKDQKLENMQSQALVVDEELTKDQEEAQKSSMKSTMRMLSANEALKNAKLGSLQTSKSIGSQLDLDKILAQLKVPKQAQAQVKDILNNPEKLAQTLKGFKMPSISAKTLAAGQALAKKAIKNPRATLKSFGLNMDEATLQKGSKDLMAILQMAYKALADALIANSKASNTLAKIDQVQQTDHVTYLNAILTDVSKQADKAIAAEVKATRRSRIMKAISGIVGGLLIVIGAVLCCIPGCEALGVVLIVSGVITVAMGCFGDKISKGIDDLCDKINNPKLREIAKIAIKTTIAVVVALVVLAMIVATGGAATPLAIAMVAAAATGGLVGTFAGLGGANDAIELYDDTKYDCDMEAGDNAAMLAQKVQKQQKIARDIILALTIACAVVSLGAGIASISSVQNFARSAVNTIKFICSSEDAELSAAVQSAFEGFAMDLGESSGSGSSLATASKSVTSSEDAAENASRNLFSKLGTALQKSYKSIEGQAAMRAAQGIMLFGQGSSAAVSMAEAYASEAAANYLLEASRLDTMFNNSNKALGTIGTQMMKQDEKSRESETAQPTTQERVREDVVQQAMEQQARIISEVAV